ILWRSLLISGSTVRVRDGPPIKSGSSGSPRTPRFCLWWRIGGAGCRAMGLRSRSPASAHVTEPLPHAVVESICDMPVFLGRPVRVVVISDLDVGVSRLLGGVGA